MCKIIIVKNCKDCFYCIDDSFYNLGYHCYKTGLDVNDNGIGIPEHCTLSNLPEKELLWYDNEQDDYALGWNACLNTITGEEKS